MKKTKTPLTYVTLPPLAKQICEDVEKATGLFVTYLPTQEALVILAPKPKTQIVLDTFFFFIEHGEVVLDPRRVTVTPWLLKMVTKFYNKHRKHT